ncbi:MAG: hypothetical protein Q9161_007170 [Pseudevernia consocians]
MTKEELHPYQQQALDLFSTAWTSTSTGTQPDSSVSATALAQYTAQAKDPSPGVYMWSTILAIHQYASLSPQALDSMLLIYASACKQFPNTASNEYGHGPAAGLQQLKWWLIEEADGFQGVVMPPKNIGSVDAADRSNLLFDHSKVDRDVDRVLSEVEEWREERTSWLIAAAMQARCFSLDIVRVNDGRQIKALIDSGLNRGQSRWSKANFIGACIMIRGCAKSILDHLGGGEMSDKLDSWKTALQSFLGSDNNPSSSTDFEVTYHSSVSDLSATIFHGLQ